MARRCKRLTMKNTKYKLTKETKELYGRTLHRIEAIKDFGSICKGDKGGWIEAETNLSFSGNAWVSGDAQVYGDALVTGNAQVTGNAWVTGNAQVSGNAWVYGDAWVSGNAQVYGKLKLKAGLFFGVRWSSDTEIKEVEIDDGDYLVYKGEAEFGEEDETEEMTMEEVCKALGKTIKIKK